MSPGKVPPSGPRKPMPPRGVRPLFGFVERKPGQPGMYRRGELLPLYEALPKQTRELGIVVTRTGGMKFPRYETEGGELGPLKRLPGAVVVSTLPKGTRMQFHKEESVAAEHEKLFKLGTQIAEVHGYLVKRKTPLNADEKQRLKAKLAVFAKEIGLRSRKESKSKAVDRLARAIELVDTNLNAVIVTLPGVHNDLAVRLSALRRMIPKTARTTKSVVSRFFSERNRAWKRIHLLRERLAKRVASAEERTALQREIESFSAQFIFDAEMVDDMRAWKSSAARVRMASNQLRLVHENIEFWQKRESVHWVEPWLRHVVNALSRERTTQAIVETAYKAAQRKDYAAVKKALESFAEKKE